MKYRIKNQTFQPIRLLDEDGKQIRILPHKTRIFNTLTSQMTNLAKNWIITIKRI